MAGLDIDPAVIPKAVAATSPPIEPTETTIADDSMQIDGPSKVYIPPRVSDVRSSTVPRDYNTDGKPLSVATIGS